MDITDWARLLLTGSDRQKETQVMVHSLEYPVDVSFNSNKDKDYVLPLKSKPKNILEEIRQVFRFCAS